MVRKELAPLPSLIRSKRCFGLWVLAFMGFNEPAYGLLVSSLSFVDLRAAARLLGWWQSHLWGVILAGAVSWVGSRLPVLGHRGVLVVMVVQARGVTEAAMSAQWHEVLNLQVTCQVRVVPLEGSAAEVGEGSDLT